MYVANRITVRVPAARCATWFREAANRALTAPDTMAGSSSDKQLAWGSTVLLTVVSLLGWRLNPWMIVPWIVLLVRRACCPCVLSRGCPCGRAV